MLQNSVSDYIFSKIIFRLIMQSDKLTVDSHMAVLDVDSHMAVIDADSQMAVLDADSHMAVLDCVVE